MLLKMIVFRGYQLYKFKTPNYVHKIKVIINLKNKYKNDIDYKINSNLMYSLF